VIYFDAACITKCYLNEPGEEHGFREIHTNDSHMLQAARHFHLSGVNVLGDNG